MKLTRGSIVLIGICTLDAITTLYFVLSGMAVEYNPIMKVFLDIGPAAFVMAKLVSFLPYVVVIEIYKHYNPRFTSIANRVTVGSYLLIYIACSVHCNTIGV